MAQRADPDNTTRVTTWSRYGRLDTLTDGQLTRLVRVAAHAISPGADALLALLDARRAWFETVVTMSNVDAQRALPICAFGLLETGVRIVEDLRANPRLRAEPLVARDDGPRGAALVRIDDANGRPLAVLCVLSRDILHPDAIARETLGVIGETIGAALSVRENLSELRLAHQRHLEALQLLRGVMRAATMLAIVATDRNAKISSFNRGAERLFGIDASAAIGACALESLVDFVSLRASAASRGERAREPSAVASLSTAQVLEALCGDAAADVLETMATHRGGERIAISLMITTTHDEDGAATGFVLVAQDIRERQAADRMKQEFISMISHELRTPLTSIRGALGLALGGVTGPLEPELEELLRIADSNGERLARIVNDMLDVQKIESASFELTSFECDLVRVAFEAIELNRPFAESLGVTLRWHGQGTPRDEIHVAAGGVAWSPERAATSSDSATARVFIDAGRITQVLTNLLSNAAKFSPSGSVVDVEVAPTTVGWRVSVHDRGPGIPASHAARVFEKFVHIEGREGRAKGTGLGLSIVRGIVDRHLGRVGFDPREGGGTTFWFELPLPRDDLPELATSERLTLIG